MHQWQTPTNETNETKTKQSSEGRKDGKKSRLLPYLQQPQKPISYGPNRYIESHEPLLVICRILGIIATNKHELLRFLYAIVTMIIICIMYLIHILSAPLKKQEQLLELAADGVLVISVTGTILYSIINRETYLNFYDELKLFDNNFRSERLGRDYTRVIFYAEFIGIHMLYVHLMMEYPPQWRSYKTWNYSPQHFRMYLYYHIVVTTFLARCYAKSIKYRFHVICDMLLKIKHENPFSKNHMKPKAPTKMPFLMQHYTALSRILHHYNVLFSWYFVMMTAMMHASILIPLNGVDVFFSGLRYLPDNLANDKIVMFCVIWFSFPRMLTIMVLNSCYRLESGARRVAHTAYLIVHHLVHGDFLDRNCDKIYLFELGVQGTTHHLTVWAADYFSLHYSTIITTFSGISCLVLGLMHVTQLPT